MWKAIAQIVEETGIHRSTFIYAIEKFGKAARRSGTVWMIDDESPEYLDWLQSRKRPIVVIVKAQGPGPSYAEIKRVGTSMSDPRDVRNHMLLSGQQEQAYQVAYHLVASGDIESAEKKLKECFDWVKVEK